MVYSPGIRVIIDTARNGTLDVTDDIIGGTVNIATGKNGGGDMNIELTNDRRKYDTVFTPNDRFSIHMKRIRWIQVMSGYLNSVPMVSVYANSVHLSGSDTTKRLLYSLYDAGSEFVAHILNTTSLDGQKTEMDSNLDEKIITSLVEFARWDREKIHIGRIPADWYAQVAALYESISPDFDNSGLTGGTTVGGKNIMSYGFLTVAPGGNREAGPGYGTLPKTSARAGVQDNLAPWTVNMRWAYQAEGSGTYDPFLGTAKPNETLTPAEIAAAKNWWSGRKILIGNPKTNKAVVVQAGDWGPSSSTGLGLVMDSQSAFAIGLTDHYGETPLVEVRFAPREAPLGGFQPPPEPPTSSVGAGGAVVSAGPTQISEDGLVFTDEGRLEGNARAARDFTKKNWPDVLSIGGYRESGSVATSDHPKGLAIDIMICPGGKEPTTEQVALGNSIAYWFTQNPDVFGTKYVIWNNMQYTSSQSKPYQRNDRGQGGVTLGHRDHVHVSFHDTEQTSMGQPGNGWTSVKPSDFFSRGATGGVLPEGARVSAIGSPVGDLAPGPNGGQLITSWNWLHQGNPESALLYGPRVLMNDTPVRPLIDQLMNASMREYGSAPNGDIIAWFPDYFNLYGTLARMVVQTIELERFTIMWSDRSLVTHQFVTGSIGLGIGPNAQAIMSSRRVDTHGIASVEYPEILATLINADPADPVSAGWLSPDAILQRFGARVNSESLEWIATPEAEFWAAVNAFRLSWASQFSTQVPLSFMPELFPGMILQIPEYGLQLYVDQVSHTFRFGPGGGFTTSASCIAPSTIGAQPGLYGLPRGGSWVGADERGPAYGPVLAPTPGTDTSTPVAPRRTAGPAGGGSGFE